MWPSFTFVCKASHSCSPLLSMYVILWGEVGAINMLCHRLIHLQCSDPILGQQLMFIKVHVQLCVIVCCHSLGDGAQVGNTDVCKSSNKAEDTAGVG